MKIALASDHGGFTLKEHLRTYLTQQGYEVVDFGAANDDRSDYPDYGVPAAKAVSNKQIERAVLVCGSGQGMCMVANKYRGVRAALVRDEEDARLSREHNDANVLCLGGRVTDPCLAEALVMLFLKTPFEGGRHIPRVEKIDPKGP